MQETDSWHERRFRQYRCIEYNRKVKKIEQKLMENALTETALEKKLKEIEKELLLISKQTEKAE